MLAEQRRRALPSDHRPRGETNDTRRPRPVGYPERYRAADWGGETQSLGSFSACLEGRQVSLADLRNWLASLADAEATIPARVVLARLPAGAQAVEQAETIADLTVDQAGQLMGRSPSTLRGWCREGLLPGSYRLRGRQWRIPRAAIAAFQRSEAEGAVATAAPKPELPSGRPVDLGAWRQVGGSR